MNVNEKIVDNLKKWVKGEEVGPSHVEIWPTKKCNLSCKYCGSAGKAEDELPISRFKLLVREAAELGAREFFIGGGGEPFMRKEKTLELMEYIKKKELNGLIITNGTLLEDDDLEKIIDIGWDEMIFSLDAPDPEINDSLRGDGNFKRVKNSIKKLMDKKHEKNKEKPKIAVNTVITNKNYDKIPEMVKFLENLGVEEITLQSLMNQPKTDCDLNLDSDDREKLNKILKKAKKLMEKYSIDSNISGFIEEDNAEDADETKNILLSDLDDGNDSFTSIPCYQPWYKLTVTSKGFAAPCEQIIERGEINIRFKGLREIWNSDFFERLRLEIFTKNISNICRKCCTQKIFENKEIRSLLKEMFGKNEIEGIELKELELKYKDMELNEWRSKAKNLPERVKNLENEIEELKRKNLEKEGEVLTLKNKIEDVRSSKNKKIEELRQKLFKSNKAFECEECGKIFDSERGLKIHKGKSH